MICCGATHQAPRKNKVYQNYIDQYSSLAVQHMEKYKIPASITLAQGILESGAGMSDLAKRSNNHFGIKCHKEWKGKRVYKKDDNPNDCFRVYKNVKESYEDHSRFLTQHKRYSVLFTYNIRDYKAWARGLQNCGYATDKAYANNLIKVIETYELYRFDTKSKKTKKDYTAPPVRRNFYKAGGLLYLLADANDSFDRISHDTGFKVKDLIKYNEVPEDFPINKGDVIYLEKKKKKADKPYYDHVVRIGESMHSIAQRYGIQLKHLYKMNKKDPEYVPVEGDVLRLR